MRRHPWAPSAAVVFAVCLALGVAYGCTHDGNGITSQPTPVNETWKTPQTYIPRPPAPTHTPKPPRPTLTPAPDRTQAAEARMKPLVNLPPGTIRVGNYAVHVVQPGENLSQIGWFYGTSAASLFVWANGGLGGNPDVLFPGQTIIVGRLQ